jgi:hypothetical protein
MSAPRPRLSVSARQLGDALVATADHVHRQHVGGNVEREKLRWLASMVAATRPEVAREIVLRWGAPGEVA